MSLSPKQRLILLGTHGSGFLHSVVFDEESGSLSEVGRSKICERPGWQVLHPLLEDVVYTTSHTDNRVLCLKVAPNGGVSVLDESPSHGANPLHLAITDDGSTLLVAHYGHGSRGSVSSLPLGSDGAFISKDYERSRIYEPRVRKLEHPRQDAPHPHQVLVRGDQVIVPDLGSNAVSRLRLKASGALGEVDVVEGFNPGDGPRNAVFHPNGRFMYLINELSSTLTVHSLESDWSIVSRLPIRPPAARHEHQMLACQLQLLPAMGGGPLVLLCANRDSKDPKGDAITVFVLGEDGLPEPAKVRYYHGGLKHIRALVADPSGRYVLTGGRDGGGVCVLERTGDDGTGLQAVARLDLPTVISAVWMR